MVLGRLMIKLQQEWKLQHYRAEAKQYHNLANLPPHEKLGHFYGQWVGKVTPSQVTYTAEISYCESHLVPMSDAPQSGPGWKMGVRDE